MAATKFKNQDLNLKERFAGVPDYYFDAIAAKAFEEKVLAIQTFYNIWNGKEDYNPGLETVATWAGLFGIELHEIVNPNISFMLSEEEEIKSFDNSIFEIKTRNELVKKVA